MLSAGVTFRQQILRPSSDGCGTGTAIGPAELHGILWPQIDRSARIRDAAKSASRHCASSKKAAARKLRPGRILRLPERATCRRPRWRGPPMRARGWRLRDWETPSSEPAQRWSGRRSHRLRGRSGLGRGTFARQAWSCGRGAAGLAAAFLAGLFLARPSSPTSWRISSPISWLTSSLPFLGGFLGGLLGLLRRLLRRFLGGLLGGFLRGFLLRRYDFFGLLSLLASCSSSL